MNVFIVAMENYIFLEKRTISWLQKYIVFHGCYEHIHVAAASISPIFPNFPSTLVPFSLIRNHICIPLFSCMQKSHACCKNALFYVQFLIHVWRLVSQLHISWVISSNLNWGSNTYCMDGHWFPGEFKESLIIDLI